LVYLIRLGPLNETSLHMVIVTEAERPTQYEQYIARKYLPELDGLRAFSILIVVTVHMKDRVWEWLAGAQGVTVFFVLSGYLITLLALRETRFNGCLNVRAFFVRRVFRLFPSYYFVLGIYCVLVFGLNISPERREGLARALPYYLFYMQEYPVFRNLSTNLPFYQSWSLGIEEKFYLVWPFLAFSVLGSVRSVRAWATAGLTMLMIFAPTIIGQRAGQFLYPYSHILVGCLTAFVLDTPQGFANLAWLGRRWGALLTLAGFLALHLIVPHVPKDVHRVFLSAYSVATGLLLMAIVLGDGPIQRVLRRPMLVMIGKLSYGIYLVHILALHLAEKIATPGTDNPLVSIAALLLAYLFSVCAAYLLAMAIERPGIALGRRISRRLIGTGAAR